MNSMLFQTCARLLHPILIILSIVLLYRGHNLPGGGFIGGLVAGTTYLFLALSHSVSFAREKLRVQPETLIAVGLLTAMVSGLLGVSTGAYMGAQWLPGFTLPLLGSVHLGTPVIFDIGVFLVVAGFILLVTFELLDHES